MPQDTNEQPPWWIVLGGELWEDAPHSGAELCWSARLEWDSDGRFDVGGCWGLDLTARKPPNHGIQARDKAVWDVQTGSFVRGPEHLDDGPRKKLQEVLRQRYRRHINADQQAIIDAIAESAASGLGTWVAGNILARSLSTDYPALCEAIKPIWPRYVCKSKTRTCEIYSLTFSGLYASKRRDEFGALLMDLLTHLRNISATTAETFRFDRSNPLARAVVLASRLYDEEIETGLWSIPKDLHYILGFRTLNEYLEALRHPSEKVECREWLTAPERFQSDIQVAWWKGPLPGAIEAGIQRSTDTHHASSASVGPVSTTDADDGVSGAGGSISDQVGGRGETRSPVEEHATPSSADFEQVRPIDSGPLDLAIVVALEEEFDELVDILGVPPHPVPHGELGGFDYTFAVRGTGTQYRCVARFIGEMGPSNAQAITSQVLSKWKPAAAAMLGIAASLDRNEVKLGDVVVAGQVDAYAANLKARANGDGSFRLQHGGQVYSGDWGFVQQVKDLKHAHSGAYKQWQDRSGSDLRRLLKVGARQKLQRGDHLRAKPTLHVIHLASGPVLGASQAYSDWLRERDRKLQALDMEAEGFMAACQKKLTQTPTLVVRGISDYGDEKKKRLDATGKGAIRKYAMRNTVRLLLKLLDLGMLPRHGDSTNP